MRDSRYSKRSSAGSAAAFASLAREPDPTTRNQGVFPCLSLSASALRPGFKTFAPGTIEPVLARLVDPLPHVEWDYFDVDYGEPVQAEAVADFDGVIALGSPYTAATVSGGGRMICVARWGVGLRHGRTPRR